MEDDILRSHEVGFTALMTKPIDFTKLQAMVDQVAGPGVSCAAVEEALSHDPSRAGPDRMSEHGSSGPCPAIGNEGPDQSGSIAIGVEHLAAGHGGDRAPGLVADAVLDEPYRAVEEAHVHSSGMVRAGANQGVAAVINLV